MNLLVVDPGSRLGWALSMNGTLESGVEDFSLRRGESPGARYLRLRRWLADIDELCTRSTGSGLDLIAYGCSSQGRLRDRGRLWVHHPHAGARCFNA